MFKFYKVIIFLLCTYTFSANANTETRVAYLDLDFILSNTVAGKKMFEKLKKLEDQKLQEIKSKEKSLKNEENKILSSKNIVSNDQFNLNVKEFQKKIQEYKTQKSEEINNLKKIRSDEVLNFLNLLNPLIKKYMNDNSISIILDKKNIFIANINFDITNDLIEVINKNIK